MDNRRLTSIAILLILVVPLQGCTKEKAEAVKVAAAQFRSEAVTALDQVRDILKKTVEMPPQDIEKMVVELQTDDFTSETLSFLLGEENIGEAQTAAYDAYIEAIQQRYIEFEQMFESLTKGHFFAGDAVRKAEKHAVNLTVSLIRLAQMLHDGKILVKLNTKRILLTEQIRRDNAITDDRLRQTHLKSDAQQIVSLREEERRIREEAIIQCLRAAQAGQTSMVLIKDFNSLNVRDILSLTEKTLGYLGGISGKTAEMSVLVDKFKTTEASIANDSYWSTLLDKPIEK